MAIKATLAASVQKKNGRLHAVIQVKEDGKTKSVWRALGLPEGASQTQINKAFRKVVTTYEEEYNKRLARGGRPDADIPIFPFLCAFLEKAKPRLQVSTYKGYLQMVYSRVQEYFNAHPKLTVESITPKDIEAFYKWLFGKGLKTGSVIHYHTLLHSAFQQAYKEELLIPSIVWSARRKVTSMVLTIPRMSWSRSSSCAAAILSGPALFSPAGWDCGAVRFLGCAGRGSIWTSAQSFSTPRSWKKRRTENPSSAPSRR